MADIKNSDIDASIRRAETLLPGGLTADVLSRARWAWKNGHDDSLLDGLRNEASIAAAEAGADRELDHDSEQWEETWIEAWLNAAPRETPRSIAYRVIRLVFDQTESFDEGSIGSELAYLCMAILDPVQGDYKNHVLWELGCGRHDTLHTILREHLPDHDPLWEYVVIQPSTEQS